MIVKRLDDACIGNRSRDLTCRGGEVGGQPMVHTEHFHEVPPIVRPQGDRLDPNSLDEAITSCRRDDGPDTLLADGDLDVRRAQETVGELVGVY